MALRSIADPPRRPGGFGSPTLPRLGRAYRTLRPLRWSQPFWRLRYALERRLPPSATSWPRIRSSATPPLPRADFPALPPLPGSGPRGAELVSDLEAGVFRHLGQARELGRRELDWLLGDRSVDRLWIITLHYHGWACSLAEEARRPGESGRKAADLFRRYVGDWIERCGPQTAGARELAWNSYAIATRLRCWAQAWSTARDALFANHPALEGTFLTSFWLQADWLARHLEWDLRGNHLLRDLAGMAIAGRFFAGKRAAGWLERAEVLAWRQAEEQLLPDGGHFERSAKYQADILDDLRTLSLLARGPAAGALAAHWRPAAETLAWLRHPDGDLMLFNDSSLLGPEVVREALSPGKGWPERVDAGLRSGARHLIDTGLVIWHGPAWSVFFDVGEVGPDTQPGHAHADTLGLEVSFRGRRLVVDPGTLAYDAGAARAYDRGTSSHNTLCVDQTDSSEVWHVFRVGRRARPRSVAFEAGEDGVTASACHDGYRHLPGRPSHCRRLRVSEAEASIVVVDRVEGVGAHDIEGGLLIEPGWQVEHSGRGWFLSQGRLRLEVVVHGPVERFDEPRPYHPSYGSEVIGRRLGWRGRRELPLETSCEIVEI